jgi:hypothetical protein
MLNCRKFFQPDLTEYSAKWLRRTLWQLNMAVNFMKDGPSLCASTVNTISIDEILTARSTALLEKLIGPRVVWKSTTVYATRWCVSEFTKAHHLSLFWDTWIQIGPPSPLWLIILILSPNLWLGLRSGPFSLCFPTKTVYAPLLPPKRATCHVRVIFVDLITCTKLYLVSSTGHKSPRKSTLTAGLSCFAPTGFTNVARPLLTCRTYELCCIQHTDTDSVQTVHDTCSWRCRNLSMCYMCYLWMDWLVWYWHGHEGAMCDVRTVRATRTVLWSQHHSLLNSPTKYTSLCPIHCCARFHAACYGTISAVYCIVFR